MMHCKWGIVFLCQLLTSGLFPHILVLSDDPLAPYRWKNRILLVFSPSAKHPQLIAQVQAIGKQAAGLEEREGAFQNYAACFFRRSVIIENLPLL
jgi:hypothetical protein